MVSFNSMRGQRLKWASNFTKAFGGAESNVSIGLSRLGYAVRWMSCLGRDEFGDYVYSSLLGEGVDVSFVRRSEILPTGVLFKSIVHSNKVLVSYYRKNSAFGKMKADDIDEDFILGAKYVLLSGITLSLSEESFSCLKKIIELGKKNKIPIIFDLNLRKKLWEEGVTKNRYIDVFKMGLDYVITGKNEIEFISGEIGIKANASFLLGFGSKTVVIKNSDQDVWWQNQEEQESVLCYQVREIVDPVGAGDAFVCGFVSGLLDCLELEGCVKRGCAMGVFLCFFFWRS